MIYIRRMILAIGLITRIFTVHTYHTYSYYNIKMASVSDNTMTRMEIPALTGDSKSRNHLRPNLPPVLGLPVKNNQENRSGVSSVKQMSTLQKILKALSRVPTLNSKARYLLRVPSNLISTMSAIKK